MANPDEAQRLADLLRVKIVATGHSQRQVERHLGWGKGYISQLLRGSFDLKVKHVYAILEIIGVEPVRFFAELYDLPVAAHRGGGGRPAGGLEPEDLDRLRPYLEEVVRDILDARRDEPARGLAERSGG